jgi:hypothetical protein
MSSLDRFDGYPDGERTPRNRTVLERWQEGGYEPTQTLFGHIANDYDPHEPTKDKEETR